MSAADPASVRGACGRWSGSLSSPPARPRAPPRAAGRGAAAAPSSGRLWAASKQGSGRRPEGLRSGPRLPQPPGPGLGRAACPPRASPRPRERCPLGPRRAAVADCSTDPCGRGAGAGQTGAGFRPGLRLRGGRGLRLDPGQARGWPRPRATAPHCPEGPFCIFCWAYGVVPAWAGDRLIR